VGHAVRPRLLALDVRSIPNLLTLGRVAVIPFFVWLVDKPTPARGLWACLLFSVAAMSDMVDGYLARRLNAVTILGKFLDPLADKLIVMSAVVWLCPMGRIPAWAVVLLLGRELAITGLRSVAASEGVVIGAGSGGKMKTALQMIGIVALVLGYPYHLTYFGFDLGIVDLARVGRGLVYLSLVFSFLSAAEYVQLFKSTGERHSPHRDVSA
jgi:CDP-diacylglycerol--glycerol-3-phosphate 3-phosphatidyltransferase